MNGYSIRCVGLSLFSYLFGKRNRQEFHEKRGSNMVSLRALVSCVDDPDDMKGVEGQIYWTTSLESC